MNSLKPLLATLILALLSACGSSLGNPSGGGNPNTPRTAVPTGLAQGWYNGSVSSVHFYDPATGKWGSPSGDGLFYTFTVDGRFTNGYMVQTALYGCTTFFMIWQEGTVEIKGQGMKLHYTKGQKKFDAPCASSLNEDRPLTAQELNHRPSDFIWQLVQDESNPNQTNLVMTLPDDSPWATFAPHSGF